MANAANAASMVAVAHAVAPPGYGRVMLLNVVHPPKTWTPGETPESLSAAESVLREAMTASFAEGLTPQALLTVSAHPLEEIRRVARTLHCDSVLVGLRDLSASANEEAFDRLVDRVPSDVLLLRAPPGWKFREADRVLVAVGGRGRHSPLRARLLGSLRRFRVPQATYLCVLREGTGPEAVQRMQRRLQVQADDEMGGIAEVAVECAADPAAEIIRRAAQADLLILGLYQEAGRHLRLSPFLLRIARETECALLVLGYKARG